MHNRQKHYLLSIPEPCTQDWEQMTPQDKGRHCAMCNRVIQDFTNLTDAELIDFLAKGNLHCGRFRSNQLNRFLLPEPAKAQQSFLFEKAAAAILLLSTVWSHLSAAKPGDTQIVVVDTQSDSTGRESSTVDTTVTISGTVWDVITHKPVTGAVLCITDTNYTSITNDKGDFRFLLPGSLLGKKIQVAPTEEQRIKDNRQGLNIESDTIQVTNLPFSGHIDLYRDTMNLLPITEIVADRNRVEYFATVGMIVAVEQGENPSAAKKPALARLKSKIRDKILLYLHKKKKAR